MGERGHIWPDLAKFGPIWPRVWARAATSNIQEPTSNLELRTSNFEHPTTQPPNFQEPTPRNLSREAGREGALFATGAHSIWLAALYYVFHTFHTI